MVALLILIIATQPATGAAVRPSPAAGPVPATNETEAVAPTSAQAVTDSIAERAITTTQSASFTTTAPTTTRTSKVVQESKRSAQANEQKSGACSKELPDRAKGPSEDSVKINENGFYYLISVLCSALATGASILAAIAVWLFSDVSGPVRWARARIREFASKEYPDREIETKLTQIATRPELNEYRTKVIAARDGQAKCTQRGYEMVSGHLEGKVREEEERKRRKVFDDCGDTLRETSEIRHRLMQPLRLALLASVLTIVVGLAAVPFSPHFAKSSHPEWVVGLCLAIFLADLLFYWRVLRQAFDMKSPKTKEMQS